MECLDEGNLMILARGYNGIIDDWSEMFVVLCHKNVKTNDNYRRRVTFVENLTDSMTDLLSVDENVFNR